MVITISTMAKTIIKPNSVDWWWLTRVINSNLDTDLGQEISLSSIKTTSLPVGKATIIIITIQIIEIITAIIIIIINRTANKLRIITQETLKTIKNKTTTLQNSTCTKTNIIKRWMTCNSTETTKVVVVDKIKWMLTRRARTIITIKIMVITK